MRIIVVGAGKSGLFLAEELRDKHDLTLVDQRLDRTGFAESMMPDITVLFGDACEPEVLERAGIQECDLLIAVTGDDEDNLVVAMLGRYYGSATIFARINHPRNEWLFTKEWGVDVAVSSATIMLSLVEKEIGFGDLVTLLRLQADNVEIEEITLTDASDAVGKRLADIQLPSSAQVMAILPRGGGVTVARGDTVFKSGDQLLLLSDGASDDAIKAALGLK